LEALRSFEASVTIFQSMRRDISQGFYLEQRRCKNHKSPRMQTAETSFVLRNVKGCNSRDSVKDYDIREAL
jgi:hypothetical protein